MSNQVKRYDPIGYDGMSALMEEYVEGDYVSYDDYAILQAECDQLRAELAVIKAYQLKAQGGDQND